MFGTNSGAPRRELVAGALSLWVGIVITALCGTFIAYSQDCNGNGIPDNCDISCGSTGGPCDVPGCGLSEDCNGNGIPDECDTATPALPVGGMTLWLRADSGVVTPGGITRWVDQSGMSNDYVPVEGSGTPVLAIEVLNYYPVVRFDGVDDRLTNGGQLITGTQFTIFTVLRMNAGDYAWEIGGGYPNRIYYERGPGAGDPSHVGNTLDVAHDNGNDVRASYPGISTAEFRLISVVADQTLSGTRVYVGGHAAEVQLTGSDQPWELGGGQNNLGWMTYPAFGRVDIAEFIVYDRLLTDPERRYVERYLGAKYFDTVGPNDCDSDGVPDECEWIDCNGNGVFDACDLADGTSLDCNENGVPDECDLADGTSSDCMDAYGFAGNPNGIPDECDLLGLQDVYSRPNPSPSALAWSDKDTWCPALVPNGGDLRFHVTLPGELGTTITLDMDSGIASLSVESGAILQVNADSGASLRTLTLPLGTPEAPNWNYSAGALRAADGRILCLTANLDQTAGGELQASGAGCVQVNNRIRGGIARASGESSRIQLNDNAALQDIAIYRDDERAAPVEVVHVPGEMSGRVEGVIENTCVIGVGTGSESGGLLWASFATLSGPGWLRLGNDLAMLICVQGPLTNGQEHTIAGSGYIFGGPANLGTIVADSPGGSLYLEGPGSITNDGLLAATDGGVLRVNEPVVGTGGLEASNGGTILVDSGKVIALEGAVTVRDQGVFTYTSQMTAPTFVVGSMTVAGAGALATLGGMLGATINGPVRIDGLESGLLRGCTPPILQMAGSLSLSAESFDILNGGTLFFSGDPSVHVAGALLLDQGGVIEGEEDSGAVLSAAAVTIADTGGSGGQLLLREGMGLDVAGDLVLNRFGARGCTPPILQVPFGAAVSVRGSFVETGGVMVNVATENFDLGGDFDLGSSDPASFHWEQGGLRLISNGPVGFEAASTDRGMLGEWTDNFVFGRLELGRYGTVEVHDARDNDPAANGPCTEAVYAEKLVLRAGTRLILDNCSVYCKHLVDDGALIKRVGCGRLYEPGHEIGDLNCDLLLNVFDIDPFVLALTDEDAYAAAFPACDWMRADVNGDGRVNTFDIDPFIAALVSGQSGNVVRILLVACRTNGTVLAFKGSTGQFIRELIGPGVINDPNQVVPAPDSGFYIASAHDNVVIKFSVRSGEEIVRYGGTGFSAPDGIVATRSALYVASYDKGSVSRFDPFSATLLGDVIVPNPHDDLDGASGLQMRPNGNFVVASQRNDMVLEYNPQGACMGHAALDGELDAPYSLLLDSHGSLLVSSFGNSAVARYGPDGRFLGYLVAPDGADLHGPGGIAEMPDGSYLVASRYNHRVLHYAADGAYLGVFALGSGLAQPTGLALVEVYDDDCNNNGILDRWDIDLGFSTDLDGNDVPDECDGR